MPNNRYWDMELLMNENESFDYVEHSVNSWREWIAKAENAIEAIEVKEIKLLVYFSIMEMMAQEYSNFPTKNLQASFTQFVLRFQDKYDYLGLTDPVTLYYREEKLISSDITLAELEDGNIYFPESAVVREIASAIRQVITTKKDEEYANRKMCDHRYVDLLYRMRCRLSHEFAAPNMSHKENTENPYYINCAREYLSKGKIMNDEVWQLRFPVSFIKNLCLNCFENYLNHCLETNTSPNKNNGMDRLCELSWYSR